MGKVKKKISAESKVLYMPTAIYDPELDNAKFTYLSDKEERTNKMLENLELPKFDKDGNYMP